MSVSKKTERDVPEGLRSDSSVSIACMFLAGLQQGDSRKDLLYRDFKLLRIEFFGEPKAARRDRGRCSISVMQQRFEALEWPILASFANS